MKNLRRECDICGNKFTPLTESPIETVCSECQAIMDEEFKQMEEAMEAQEREGQNGEM